MIRYSEALNCISEIALELRDQKELYEVVSIKNATGRVSFNDVFSTENIPNVDNSAMDGFALRSVDIQTASIEHPIELKVVGSIAAGDLNAWKEHNDLTENTSVEIMTGAPIPLNGADCVVKIEDVKCIHNQQGKIISIVISKPLHKYENIRRFGSDLSIGDKLLSKNTKISSENIMVLSSVGISEIKVYKKLKVGILSTGSEIVDAGIKKIEKAQVRNSTTAYIQSICEKMMCDVVVSEHVTDDPVQFRSKFEKMSSNRIDVIFTTGAVSMGKYDFIPNVLRELNSEIYFHKVAIRPGKPIIFAKTNDNIVVFGLPGNPVSSAIGLRFFFEPYLRSYFQLEKESIFKAKLLKPTNKMLGLRTFLKANIKNDCSQIYIEPQDGQSSHIAKSLQNSNAWIIADEELQDLQTNQIVNFVPIDSELM